MVLPRKALLEGSRHPLLLASVVDAAEQALRTWEPVWTPLLPPQALEEAQGRLGALAELNLQSWGGFPGAERRRLLLQRQEAPLPWDSLETGLCGLEISGNFLFDPATTGDLVGALAAAGVVEGERGDLWLRGDRGGQAVLLAPAAERLHGQSGQVRTVPVTFEQRPLEELQLPVSRQPRPLAVVEASLRLDAVASAGFGVSRSRMATAIRQGEIRVDWQPVLSPSRELAPGERVRWQGRGELAVVAVAPTKRGRLRIELLRQ